MGHRWQDTDPDELARTARRCDWTVVRWWAAAFAWTALWWAFMLAAYVWGQR